MGDGWVVLDGELMPLGTAAIPVDDVGFLRGWTVFDSMKVEPGGAFDARHLDRLERSATLGLIEMPPRELLVAEILRAAEALGAVARVRVTLSGSGRRVVMATHVERGRIGRPVRVVTRPWTDLGVPHHAKHGSRMAWMLLLKASGADEVVLVDEQQRFVEGTTSAVVAVVAGVLRLAAPGDPRLLPSTSVQRLIERAEVAGVPVLRKAASMHDPIEGLYLASSFRGLAPVAELDGRAMPMGEPVGKALAVPLSSGS